MVRVIQLVLFGVRLMLPFLVRAAVVIVRMCLLALMSWWVGIPRACSMIAEGWVDTAVSEGFPTLYTLHLYRAVYLLALIIILACWVVFSLVTTLVLSVIF